MAEGNNNVGIVALAISVLGFLGFLAYLAWMRNKRNYTATTATQYDAAGRPTQIKETVHYE